MSSQHRNNISTRLSKPLFPIQLSFLFYSQEVMGAVLYKTGRKLIFNEIRGLFSYIQYRKWCIMATRISLHFLNFVRENEGQLIRSNCCGKLEGDWRMEHGRHIFAEQRAVLARIPPLTLALHAAFPRRLEIFHVDPRNHAYLFPKIAREIIRRCRFSVAGLRALFVIYRLPAIISG